MSRRHRFLPPSSGFWNKAVEYDFAEEAKFLADLRKGNPPANFIVHEGIPPLLRSPQASSGMSSPAGLCADVVSR